MTEANTFEEPRVRHFEYVPTPPIGFSQYMTTYIQILVLILGLHIFPLALPGNLRYLKQR